MEPAAILRCDDMLFEPLTAAYGDKRFAFDAKTNALGSIVAAKWGWDEAFQWSAHERRYEEKPWYAIVQGTRIGTVSWKVAGDHARFGEFYLLDGHRGKGLGTRVLAHFLQIADRSGVPVRLEYLKWNPVGRLYRRHGFVDTHETENHFFMERPTGG